MIQIDNFIEIGKIDDLTTRSQRVLDEVQPVARKVMDAFVAKYGERDSYLRRLRVHTYESTLKTTITDSRNPKYAEKKQDYGKKAFVELIDEQYYEAPLVILRLEFNLYTNELRLCMTSDFYPFMVYSAPAKINELTQMILDMDPELEIFTGDENKTVIPQENFIESVQEYNKNKRKPGLSFGKILPFDSIHSEDEIVDELWSIYEKLVPVRSLIKEEAEHHSEAMRLFDNFRSNANPIQITVYSKTYQFVIEKELKKIKTNTYKQLFSIYEKDQLISNGFFQYSYRLPTEVLGVIINDYGIIYPSIRGVANGQTNEWYIKKSFSQRGKHKENQIYKEQSVLELKKHGFTLNGLDAFYVGTYEKNNHAFTEPIEVIKERLITACAIFADIRDIMTFPKGGTEADKVDGVDEENLETLSSSFDFETIMDLVEQSGFTFSIDIIRDFYLNLTSLDDKHFVILNGISGTGKTQLCRVFANAVYGLDYNEDHPYLKIIAVRPDWTDGTSLFGYYSSFEKRYMKTEFLDMLLQANAEKDKPHFVVLDEMNLARVEYYLSDYLSGIESRKPIQLHNIDEVTDVPKTIEIPHNFYLIGTINVDETTHSLSDKVLDRSFVMTLSDVNFDTFWETLDSKLKETVQEEWPFLLQLHEVLAVYELHFGYRTMNEMLRKLYKNSLLPEEVRMDKWIGLDRVISEKVLPKIRGDERIDSLLIQLDSMFTIRFGEESESLKHIVRMRKELDRYGASQFWR